MHRCGLALGERTTRPRPGALLRSRLTWSRENRDPTPGGRSSSLAPGAAGRPFSTVSSHGTRASDGSRRSTRSSRRKRGSRRSRLCTARPSPTGCAMRRPFPSRSRRIASGSISSRASLGATGRSPPPTSRTRESSRCDAPRRACCGSSAATACWSRSPAGRGSSTSTGSIRGRSSSRCAVTRAPSSAPGSRPTGSMSRARPTPTAGSGARYPVNISLPGAHSGAARCCRPP